MGWLSDAISTVAPLYNVPASILTNLVQAESSGNPYAIGAKGEIGLTQVLPQNAGSADLYDPTQNLAAGASILGTLYSKYGNWTQALSAYNSGDPNSPVGQTYAQNILKGISASDLANGGAAEGAAPVSGTPTTLSVPGIGSVTLPGWQKVGLYGAVVIVVIALLWGGIHALIKSGE